MSESVGKSVGEGSTTNGAFPSSFCFVWVVPCIQLYHWASSLWNYYILCVCRPTPGKCLQETLHPDCHLPLASTFLLYLKCIVGEFMEGLGLSGPENTGHLVNVSKSPVFIAGHMCSVRHQTASPRAEFCVSLWQPCQPRWATHRQEVLCGDNINRSCSSLALP